MAFLIAAGIIIFTFITALFIHEHFTYDQKELTEEDCESISTAEYVIYDEIEDRLFLHVHMNDVDNTQFYIINDLIYPQDHLDICDLSRFKYVSKL